MRVGGMGFGARFLAATAGCAITLAGLAFPASGVRAGDDAGIREFFNREFGIGEPQQPAFDPGLPDDRPLVVRPHKHRSVARRPETKIAVGPVGPVSIYADTTLKRGDAVMTKTGVRIFLGGHMAPYTDADFVALDGAQGVPRQVEKALVVIDKAPRT